MTIYRGTVERFANCDSLVIHERLPSGLWDVCSAGDFHCVADRFNSAQRDKAFYALRRATKKIPIATFYYCDMGDSWQGRKFDARYKSQFGRR